MNHLNPEAGQIWLRSLAESGQTGREIVERDWARTPLGPIEAWPASLRIVLATMLACPSPMFLAWGPALVSLYNDAYRPIFGNRLARSLGAPFPEIWGDLWPEIGPMVEAALGGESVSQRDLPLTMHRQGVPEVTWWTFSYSPVRDEEGQIAGMICLTSETTANILAERHRRESDERLQMALSAGNSIGTWDWDVASDRVTADARFARLYGVDPDLAASGAPIASFFSGIHPDDREAVQRGVEEALQTGEDWGQEYRLVQADGSTRWVAAQGRCTLGPDGAPLRFPGVSYDISQRKATEAALRESEESFRAITNSVDQILWVARPDGERDYFNDRWYAFTGLPRGATDGESWKDICHPDDREAFELAWRTSLETGMPYRCKLRLRHRSGAYRWMLSRALPMQDADGRVTRWFGSSTDIQDLTLAEERQTFLLALHDRLRETAQPEIATLGAATALGLQVGATRAGYGEVDDEERVVRIDREWTRDQGTRSFDGAFIKLASFGSHGAEDLQAGRTVVVNDCRTDPRVAGDHGAIWDKLDCRALVAVPLVRGGRLRAVLYLHESRPRTWTEAEIQLAEDTAQRSWDAVERLRAEAALQANAQELRLIADAMPVLIGFVDSDLTYRFANAAYHDWFGLDPDQLIGRRVQEIFGPEQFEARRLALERALAGEEVRFEIAWPPLRGRPRMADTRYLPRRRRDGEVDGIYVFVQDISDRKNVELTLERQVGERTRERDRLWQATNDLMATIGADGYLKSINPAWERLLGWGEDSLRARPLIELVDPPDRPDARAAMEQLAAGEPVTGIVSKIAHADGSRRTVVWGALPESGESYLVGRDISEQREAEARLWQAQKMEAVGQLTGGIAHDFNNLLTGIVGSLELMQSRIATGQFDRIDRYARTALASAHRATALTHRLLAFARRQPLEQKAVDATALIAGMADLLRRTISERVQLEIVTTAGLWPILCDPHQLENAILNLAINARDAMPDGGRLVIESYNAHGLHGALDKSGAPEAGGDAQVCIRVTDTGCGMPPDIAARAFEPFFTTKPLGMGTGLGLSMIYGFAQQSGGQTRIESELGKGTTVKIYLPRHSGEVAVSDGDVAVAESPRAESGETVLVVEDEPIVRDLVVDVLRDLGYRALEAADGPAGLAILQTRKRVDLLVTDVGLPGLNGRQLADLARITRPGLKVLFMTGYAENATFGGMPGDMQLITKPFAVDALATRIREMIAA